MNNKQLVKIKAKVQNNHKKKKVKIIQINNKCLNPKKKAHKHNNMQAVHKNKELKINQQVGNKKMRMKKRKMKRMKRRRMRKKMMAMNMRIVKIIRRLRRMMMKIIKVRIKKYDFIQFIILKILKLGLRNMILYNLL